MAAILENGGHIEILRGPRFFFLEEYLCQIWCLYHDLNFTIWVMPYVILMTCDVTLCHPDDITKFEPQVNRVT